MVRELFVRDGKYTNLFPGVGQPHLLGIIEAKGKSGKEALYENDATKSTSAKAKSEAMKKAKGFEKQGWKLVSIRAIYSYGNDNPYRYDIESWGGFKE